MWRRVLLVVALSLLTVGSTLAPRPIKHLYTVQKKHHKLVVGGEVVPEAMTVIVMAESENWHRSSVVHTISRKTFELEWKIPRGEEAGTVVDVVVVAFDAENKEILPPGHSRFFLTGEDDDE